MTILYLPTRVQWGGGTSYRSTEQGRDGNGRGDILGPKLG